MPVISSATAGRRRSAMPHPREQIADAPIAQASDHHVSLCRIPFPPQRSHSMRRNHERNARNGAAMALSRDGRAL